MKTHIVEATCEDWQHENIANKIPNIYLETQGKFIPQSLNLDLMNAINFKKGCYTGQEIIARTHYLGTVKKRLYRGYCSASKTFLELGDDILVDGISVGQVIDYSYDKSGAAILCEMKIESVKSKCFLRDNPINIIDEST